jgi:hypothetical protein
MALNISAGIVPTGGGAWETHDAQYGKGGWRAVADNTARDAISTLRRSEGMFVYIIATGNTYRLGAGLTNGDWVLQSAGTIAAGNGLTGTTTFSVLANGASIEVSSSGIRRAALSGAVSAAAGSNVTAFASGDFGVLNLLSSGYLQLGLAPGSGAGVASAAATGSIRGSRGSPGFSLYARNNLDTGDVPLILWDSTSGTYQLGKSSAPNQPTDILLDASSTVRLRAGAATYGVSISSGGVFTVQAPTLTFEVTQTPTLTQQNDVAGAAGKKLTIKAQTCTAGGSTGGACDIGPGAGAAAGGLARCVTGGGTARFSWNDTGIGFYTTAPVAQPADIGALTDAFGAADGTIADVTAAHDQTILNNNFQDLSTKINAIRTALRTLGLMA